MVEQTQHTTKAVYLSICWTRRAGNNEMDFLAKRAATTGKHLRGYIYLPQQVLELFIVLWLFFSFFFFDQQQIEYFIKNRKRKHTEEEQRKKKTSQ